MRPEPSAAAARARVRRARRDDVPMLLECTGGPPEGRARALRRLQKTLAADVYVLDRGSRLDGVVAVTYRRSLAHGGLVATIDALALLGPPRDSVAARDDRTTLLNCALDRARRRGCVAIDTGPSEAEVAGELESAGFTRGGRALILSLKG